MADLVSGLSRVILHSSSQFAVGIAVGVGVDYLFSTVEERYAVTRKKSVDGVGDMALQSLLAGAQLVTVAAVVGLVISRLARVSPALADPAMGSTLLLSLALTQRNLTERLVGISEYIKEELDSALTGKARAQKTGHNTVDRGRAAIVVKDPRSRIQSQQVQRRIRLEGTGVF